MQDLENAEIVQSSSKPYVAQEFLQGSFFAVLRLDIQMELMYA